MMPKTIKAIPKKELLLGLEASSTIWSSKGIIPVNAIYIRVMVEKELIANKAYMMRKNIGFRLK